MGAFSRSQSYISHGSLWVLGSIRSMCPQGVSMTRGPLVGADEEEELAADIGGRLEHVLVRWNTFHFDSLRPIRRRGWVGERPGD